MLEKTQKQQYEMKVEIKQDVHAREEKKQYTMLYLVWDKKT